MFLIMFGVMPDKSRRREEYAPQRGFSDVVYDLIGKDVAVEGGQQNERRSCGKIVRWIPEKRAYKTSRGIIIRRSQIIQPPYHLFPSKFSLEDFLGGRA